MSRLNVSNVGLLTLAATLAPGRCRAAEDGAACPAEMFMRGLCRRHYAVAKSRGLLDKVGLPPIKLKKEIRLKPPDQLQPGICRVVVNGEPCPVPAARRGLCVRHYAGIWQRPDLRLDDFAVPSVVTGDFRVGGRPMPDRCRIIERDVACQDKPHIRGMCKRHYRWLRDHDLELFERLAEPLRSSIVYTLRARLREGRCRVAENGHACAEKAWTRGLCEHHYTVVSHRPELFLQIAAPSKLKPTPVYQCKTINEPGTCRIIENGTPCTAPVEYRGVCMRHYRAFRAQPKKYPSADFLLPKAEPVYTLKPLAQLNSAVCRVIEDGQPCQETAFGRGLCRRHHWAIGELGRMNELGAAPRRAGGRNPSVPHSYLDKNVLFDWCDAQAFGASGQQASCALVERVRSGRMVATISGSAVTSVYNHARHRAGRPTVEGGQGLGEEAAETLARVVVSRMLEGTWRILALGPHDLRTVLASTPAGRSYEDALEWAAYQQARGGHNGARWFVTRDLDFPEGVPPWTLEDHLCKQDAVYGGSGPV